MLRIALICRVVLRLLMGLVVRIALIGFVVGFAAFHGGSPSVVENQQFANVIVTEKEIFQFDVSACAALRKRLFSRRSGHMNDHLTITVTDACWPTTAPRDRLNSTHYSPPSYFEP
jgi:hypothetical protein